MKTHRVIIQPSALEDLRDIARELAGKTELAGPAWYDRLIDHILSLEMFPERGPIAASESERWGIEARCILFGRKPHVRRILYTVVGSEVRVLHVTHAARNQ